MTDPTNNIFLKSIESLEKRLDDHVTKTGIKLDQIVEILQTVASLQERDQHQSEEIKRINAAIDVLFTEHRKHNAEDIANHNIIHEKHMALRTEFDQNMINLRHEAELLKNLSASFKSLDQDYKDKNSFFRGVIWILGFVLIVGNGIAVSYYNSFKDQTAQIISMQKTIELRQNEADEQFRIIQRHIVDKENR